MKNFIFAVGLVSLFTGCANMRVVNTEVATGASDPKAIYIRPFTVDSSRYHAGSNPNGEVGKSLAPLKFAQILQEELGKIAPSMVLKDDEHPTIGWLVEGELECIDSGSRTTRLIPLFGTLGKLGTSTMVMHVRVTEMRPEARALTTDAKEGVSVASGVNRVEGRVVYEFDVAGGSNHTGRFGSVDAPASGDSVSFDFHNAAERIMIALSPDPFRYGVRSSPVARN